MIVYEVNLTINNEIFNEYYDWLIKHIEMMLTFQGFHQAELAKEKLTSADSNENTKLTVRYTLESEQDLDDYLKNHASAMREDGIKKFDGKFNAFRRIFFQPTIKILDKTI